MKKFLWFLLLGYGAVFFSTPAVALPEEDSAVIFAYHRIDEEDFPLTNIGSENFRSHIIEIENNGYSPLPLKTIIDALKNPNQSLPDKTIAITFEGGHKSILDKAVPLLLEKKIPFTIFIASEMMNSNPEHYLDWDDIRGLMKNDLVTFGLHPPYYRSIAGLNEQQALTEINRARARFKEETGQSIAFFSYPFGELNLGIKTALEKAGFEAGFGLQSGVANRTSDFFMVPRFAMTEGYGDLNRFQLTANALPLPAWDIMPADPLLTNAHPNIGFSIPEELAKAKTLACFAPSEGRLDLQQLNNRIEIRLKDPFTEGRARINCTMPAGYDENGNQRWRWFGMLFSILPHEESGGE